MSVTVGWVKPPQSVTGLDHLGVQEPCINIYQQLLPGLTNVTDRARYYSFYTWFVWAYEQSDAAQTDENFTRLFRRADCLFTLIAARHARACADDQEGVDEERHGARMVGRDTLLNPLTELENEGETIQLSTYATQENANERYFKNRLGGLGQYYLSTMHELGLLDSSQGSTPRYTVERGEPLAVAVDMGVDRARFFACLEQDTLTISDLDALCCFCPCQLCLSSEEHRLLTDLFFDRNSEHASEGVQRRSSLGLILDLVQRLEDSDNLSINEGVFRHCVYTSHVPNRDPWVLTPTLEKTRRRWAVYERNELLSIAMQGMFCCALGAMQDANGTFETPRQFADWYISSPEVSQLLGSYDKSTWGEAIRSYGSLLPPIARSMDESHELSLAGKIESSCRQSMLGSNRADVLDAALRIIMALCYRREAESEAYDDLFFPPEYFLHYPVNLKSLYEKSKSEWAGVTVSQVLHWLILEWCLEVHIRVALRKLRYQTKDTFRFRPTDIGLEVVAVPPPVFTNPRFRQALQILQDIGALEKNAGGDNRLSALGRELLDYANGN